MSVAILIMLLRWSDWFRPTNAHAANARGVKSYAAKQYVTSVQSFREASSLHPTPAAAFNLGTSEIAAGKTEEGAAALSQAMQDPSLRALALYNRGNGALASKAYDYAIRDYTESLRVWPNNRFAKRNLEIALARKAMQQSGGGKESSGGGQQQKPQSKKGGDERKPTQQADRGSGDPNADALLRAVQQQEKEELSRMRRQRPEERKIGW